MAGLFGSLSALLPGAGELSPEDRRALITQGLLAFGAGTLANNTGNYGKAGPAIGAGLSQGLLAVNKGADDLAERRYRAQVMAQQQAGPAELRTFESMTRGLTEADKEKARRIALGLEGRASSAGFGFDMVPDANGVPRPQRMNPRTGQIEVFVAESQQWVPLGGGAAPPRIDPSLPPEVQAYIRQNEPALAALPSGASVQIPTFTPAPVPGLGRGRRKEDEAGAVAAAQKSVELQALPAELGMRTDAAIRAAAGTTTASEQAKTRTEAQRNLPKAIQQAEVALGTIQKLETHPGLSTILGVSGKVDPRNYLPGTEAQGARTLADQIQGQTFLQAYQTLRGGGQITEVEGKKAEAAIAGLNRAQSEADYRARLNDLKEVITNGLQKAKEQAGYSSDPSSDPLGIL